jgi:hypothetical protein
MTTTDPLTVECPHCQAQPGQRCRTPNGTTLMKRSGKANIRTSHVERWALIKEKNDHGAG